MLIGDALVYTSPEANIALGWAWVFELGIDFIPAAFITLIAAFTSPEKDKDYLKWLAGGFWILGIILYALDRSSLVSQQAIAGWSGYSIRAVPIQYLLISSYVASFTLCYLVSLMRIRNTSRARRKQYLALMAAYSIEIVLSITYFAAPNGLHFPVLSHMGTILANIVMLYAIQKYQVLNVATFVKKSLAYSVAMAVLAGAYVAFIRLGEVFIQTRRPDITMNLGVTVVAIILIAIAFEPLRGLVQRIVDKMFFKTRYEYQEAIKQFSRMVVTILDLDLLLHRTAITIQDILKIQQAVIFIHNPEAKRFEIGAFAGVDEKRLPAWTYTDTNPLVERLRASNRRVQDLNDDFGSSVVVSLFINQDLIGFLVLGEKVSGDAYSPTDFDLLSTLADQLAIAIENARLYKAAVTDKVTRVFTGAYFYDRLDEEVARSREQGTKLAVVFFDADGFLNLSRDRGAGATNQALSVMGSVIRSNSHVYDIAARIGDDEFGVIMPGADRNGALFAARLIEKEIKHAKIDGEEGLITVSIGIAFTEKGAKTSSHLISDARKALLSAKAKNKAPGQMFGND